MSERQIFIGRVAAPFGVRGEVKVVVLTDFPERFDEGGLIKLNLVSGARRELRVERSRPHSSSLVLKLAGIEDRDAAEELRDADIVIDASDVRTLDEGSYYVFDVIGLRVVTDDGREQGEITEVLQSAANDVYVTSTGLCIPALKDVVVGVDLAERRMVIRPVPGLLPDE